MFGSWSIAVILSTGLAFLFLLLEYIQSAQLRNNAPTLLSVRRFGLDGGTVEKVPIGSYPTPF